MAKEIAIGKRAKISEAQQYMLLSVLCAAIFLGVAISLTTRFIKQIIFNTDVIAEQEKSIAAYSKVIKNTGVCVAPQGEVYSDDELAKCDPDNIEISQIPNTLRSNVLEKLAANEALSSVPDTSNEICRNPQTGKQYTYKQLNDAYKKAANAEARKIAFQNIKTCSALRVIPDALPASKNEEALLASLNQLFNMSGWVPQSISPSGNAQTSSLAPNLNAIDVSVSVEANAGIATNVLDKIERSIREFDISRATIEWNNSNLTVHAQASAYYTTPSSIKETTKTLSAEGNKK